MFGTRWITDEKWERKLDSATASQLLQMIEELTEAIGEVDSQSFDSNVWQLMRADCRDQLDAANPMMHN